MRVKVSLLVHKGARGGDMLQSYSRAGFGPCLHRETEALLHVVPLVCLYPCPVAGLIICLSSTLKSAFDPAAEMSIRWFVPGSYVCVLQLCSTASAPWKCGLSSLLLRMYQGVTVWEQILLRLPPASQICKSDVSLVTEGWRDILNSMRYQIIGRIWAIPFLFPAVLNREKKKVYSWVFLCWNSN